MNISIISQNGHRINEYMADMMAKALEHTGHNVARFYDKDNDASDVILMTNGMGMTQEALDAYASPVPVIYFHDELKSTIVPCKGVTILSQYENHGDAQFPVAQLSLFDSRWEDRQLRTQLYDFVYWGHKKEGREELYEKLPNNAQCLYIGEWEDKDKSHHTTYIRDRDLLLNTIAMGKRTIVNGSEYDDNHGNVPLRIYEALMMGVIPDEVDHSWSSIDRAMMVYVDGGLKRARHMVTEWLEDVINEYS